MEARALGRQLDEHGDRAVALRPRHREEAVRDLPLNHHAPVLDRGQPVQAFRDQRCGDLVRQVGDELSRRRVERLEWKREGVPEDKLDVFAAHQRIAQVRLEAAVELDGVDEAHTLGQIRGEDAETGADLEHDVFGSELREAARDAEDVVVDQGAARDRGWARQAATGGRRPQSHLRRSRSSSSLVLAPRLGQGERMDDMRRISGGLTG
jgi:hypothetical protein